jgi:hypothetical protein
MQLWSVLSLAVRPYNNLNILIQLYEEWQEPLNRTLPELTPQHFGDVWLPHAKHSSGILLLHVPLVHNCVNLEG